MKKNKTIKNIKTRKDVGYTLVTSKRPNMDIVTLIGSIEAGYVYGPKNNQEVASLFVEMLDEGTSSMTKDEYHQVLEGIGASISFSLNALRLKFKVQCLPQHLTKVLGILVEQLEKPRLQSKGFKRQKLQLVSRLQQLSGDTNEVAKNTLFESLYPKGHPLHEQYFKKQSEAVQKATLTMLRNFHKDVIGANDLKIVVVSGLEEKKIATVVKSAFGSWGSKNLPVVESYAKLKNQKKDVVVTLKDKSSTDVFIAAKTDLTAGDPAILPLQLGMEIFGGAGLTARLMSTVREKEGLTYNAKATLVATYKNIPGFWLMYSTFAPKLVRKGATSLMRQLNLLIDKGITRKEFERIKQQHLGRFLFYISSSSGLAHRLLFLLETGRSAEDINNREEELRDITRRDINVVLRKYLKTHLVTVKAGSVTSTGKPL